MKINLRMHLIVFIIEIEKYLALEDRLYMFLNQLLSNRTSINDDILLSKAKEFACFFPEIAKDGFRFSHGWEDWLVKINNDF